MNILKKIGEVWFYIIILTLTLAMLILVDLFVFRVQDFDDEKWNGFKENLLVEAHGIIVEIILLGLLLAIFQYYRRIWESEKSAYDTIDNYRPWQSGGATVMIKEKIFQLQELKKYKLNLNFCFLENIDLSNYNLNESSFIGTKFNASIFVGSNLLKTFFNGAILTNCNFTNSIATSSNFEFCNFYKSNFYNANFSKCFMACANLSYTKLIGANFESAYLNNVNFENADLRGANFKNADFKNIRNEIYNTTNIDPRLYLYRFYLYSIHENYFDNFNEVNLENAMVDNEVWIINLKSMGVKGFESIEKRYYVHPDILFDKYQRPYYVVKSK